MADEFMELVWENGQVSKRGRSTSPSSFRFSSHNHYSPKAQPMTTYNTATTATGEDIHIRKEPRLGSFNSALYLDDYSLMGQKEVAKHAVSLQDHSAETFHGLIGNDMNMFLETATRNNPYYQLQIVPDLKDKNSSRPEINASPMEIPVLETANGQMYKSNLFQECQLSAGINKSNVNYAVPAEDSVGVVPEPASGSRNHKNMQQTIRQMTSPGDEQSQAPGDESVSSRRTSNDLSYSSFQTEGTESPSENNAEDQQVPKSARSGVKRRPSTQEVHRISEKKRRNKINKKMRELQALVPNSDKVDKVSMLDKAIEYLQTLQLQLKIMSLGNGFCMPQSQTMVPTGMQQIQAPHLGHFSHMALRMGMGMGMASNSDMLRVAGGQVVAMPMQLPVPQPRFIPLVSGGSSTVTPLELMQRSSPVLNSKTQSSFHVCSCRSVSLDQEMKKKKKKKMDKKSLQIRNY